MSQISFKRGSSFAARVAYTPKPDGPADLFDMVIKSEIRTKSGAPVCTLDIVKADDGRSFTATATAGTAGWEHGTFYWDIKFDYQGVVFYSETVTIVVTKEVTQ